MVVDGEEEDNKYMQVRLPPGEEGMFLSHEGGEDERCRELLEDSLLPE